MSILWKFVSLQVSLLGNLHFKNPLSVSNSNMAPPLQVIKRHRPWSDGDLPRTLTVNHPAAYKNTVFIVNQAPGETLYYKESITANLYNCNTCPDIVNCLETITGTRWDGDIQIKRGRCITDSLNRIFAGKCCAICLKENNFSSLFLPDRWVCSPACEENFIRNFVAPFKNNPHRLRAAWFSSLDFGSSHYMWNEPKCGLHLTNRACMLHYIDYGRLDYMIRSGENSTKNRKKRFKTQKREFVRLPTNMLDFMDRKSAGSICGGIKCDKDLGTHEYRGSHPSSAKSSILQ